MSFIEGGGFLNYLKIIKNYKNNKKYSSTFNKLKVSLSNAILRKYKKEPLGDGRKVEEIRQDESDLSIKNPLRR